MLKHKYNGQSAWLLQMFNSIFPQKDLCGCIYIRWRILITPDGIPQKKDNKYPQIRYTIQYYHTSHHSTFRNFSLVMSLLQHYFFLHRPNARNYILLHTTHEQHTAAPCITPCHTHTSECLMQWGHGPTRVITLYRAESCEGKNLNDDCSKNSQIKSL